MKTPITYYGGKQTLLKYLLPLIPQHKLYCEPFFGGGAVFFAKPKSDVEVINDINGEVINFFIVIILQLTTILLNFSVFFFFNFSLLDSDPGRKMNAPCESGSRNCGSVRNSA